VEVAREAGWDAWGVEPSSWAVQEAQRHNLPIIQGTLDSPEVAAMRFDAVTMWDVIEHVYDPQGELRKAFGVLNPGGYIAVHTMDIESRMAKLMGERWPWLMAMHIHYFSQRTLAAMLEKVGFEVVWSGAQGRYIRLNYLSSRIGGFNPTAGRMADRVFRGLGVAEKPVAIKLGDLFTVYARKPS
ncbi:MAG: class I SAM-dependent methyltransferase, partial [Anaerolineales bacterium]|nr:class I SAM-dependent methyltransferase [Anaerolineales bacterium]